MYSAERSESVESNLFLNLALILLATKIFGLFTRKIHLPQVVGALMTGIIFGPALLGIIEPCEIFSVIAEIGVLLILFEAGLETDLNKLRKSFKSLLIIASFGVAASLGGGFLLSYLFGQSVMKSIFLGVIIMSSSVGITVEVLHELGKLNSKTGTIILGTSAVEDIFTVIIFSVVIGMGGAATDAKIGMTLLMIFVFFVLALACGFVSFKIFEFLSEKFGMARRLSVFGLAFCFLMAYAADFFGLANIMGAYIAGLVLCNSKAEKYIEQKSEVLSFMFFSPIFFASIGLQISFNGLGSREFLFAALLIFVASAAKFFGCGIGAKIFKFTTREAAQIGAGMVARCEFPVVAAGIGMSLGLVDATLFSVVIIMVIVTALISPVLLKVFYAEK
ncbi:MAG: cation:proton antiporter [Defluviitaleaceae bacterium]|nr:cation:proton antiporter [Defluviitaleaceae bacterium]